MAPRQKGLSECAPAETPAHCAGLFAQPVKDAYDYIVVGSGAGGGPVAANLAKAGFEVLLLEAGGAEEPFEYQVPAFHPFAVEHPDMSWTYWVRAGETGKRACYPRAGALGGCTAHHAMVFIYPHNNDWRQIADETGDRSWTPWRMRSYFQRLERCEYARRRLTRWFNLARHGFSGWLSTSLTDTKLLLRDLTLARLVLAAAETSFNAYAPSVDGLVRRIWTWATAMLDPNSWSWVWWRQEGVVLPPMTTTRFGRRNGTRELIRETMLAYPRNLTVKLHALVTRVILDADNRATGVEYCEGVRLYRAAVDPEQGLNAPHRTVHAKQEVILAAGTFNTPQLLMLSGIGPRKHLQRHGIEVKVESAGVGRNLQDRYEAGIVHTVARNFEILRDALFCADKKDREFADWHNGHGLYTTNGAVIAIIKRSSYDQPDPDLYIFALPGPFKGYYPGWSKETYSKNKLSWVVLKGHTNNAAGWVRLKSTDPREPPRINFSYFDAGSDKQRDDMDALLAGVAFVRRITQRTAGLLTEDAPGAGRQSREQLAKFFRSAAWGHHASGTCKIGTGSAPYDVLDSRFRVRGVKNLRVVDASVFPRIPGLFIMSAVYMIGEKASDVIIADARPKPWRRIVERICLCLGIPVIIRHAPFGDRWPGPPPPPPIRSATPKGRAMMR